MEGQAQWYVVHTYSGYENKVMKDILTTVENSRMVINDSPLQELIVDVRIPLETVTEIKDGKETTVERKIFPGYVLVKMAMCDETWHVVRNIRGCTGFVGPNGKPVPLTKAEVEKLGIDAGSVRISIDYKAGDSVQIVSGPLEGFIAFVEEVNSESGKVKVKVSMFGRETPAELELSQVKPLAD